ncbi:zinc finger protein 234-like [Haliotis cracherodii]|uniref:zinc finger protein 234-like n=1 Tax=Haliotis cracherodii TaxID=6455 RepID=UPI0039E9B9EC
METGTEHSCPGVPQSVSYSSSPWAVVLNQDQSTSDSSDDGDSATQAAQISTADLHQQDDCCRIKPEHVEKSTTSKRRPIGPPEEHAPRKAGDLEGAGWSDDEDFMIDTFDDGVEKPDDPDDKPPEDRLVSDRVLRHRRCHRLQCNQCGMYIEEKCFKNHVTTAHLRQKTNFLCKDCGKGFNFKSGLILHRAKHHGGKLLKRTMKSASPRSESKKIKKSDKNVKLFCDVCRKTFKHITSLSIHLEKHALPEIFECGICNKPFITKVTYEEHREFHDGLQVNQCYICGKLCGRKKHSHEAQYECDKCSKMFFEATHLAIHMVTHVQHGGIQCSVCKLKFPCKTDYDQHVKQHTEGDEPKRCEICGKSFPTKSLLKGHVSMVHLGKKGHPCNICGEEFFKLKHLQAHHRDHAVKKVIACNICGESFALRSSLRTHMRVHQNDVIYKCVVCPKQVTDMDALKVHVDGHGDEDSLDCCVCGMQLADCDEAMAHIRKHRGGQLTMTEEEYKSKKRHGCSGELETGEQKERVSVKCTVCHKTFHFVSSLQSHMRIHQTDQLLNCHICREAWPGVKVLREHIKTHRKDLKNSPADPPDIAVPSTDAGPTKSSEVGKKKRHRCDICLQKFVSYYGCKTHRLLHTGEKPFRCDVCGQSYVLAGSLKVHMLSHTNERPHVCEICGKSFKQPYILREHQMSHTGKKPFLCDLCGKSFVNKKKLKLHTFVHTRETPFNCKVCGRGFRAFVTRQKHKCEGRPTPQDPSADASEVRSRDVGLVAVARPHTEQVQLPHEYPASMPSYGDFAYTSVPGPEYNVSNLGYKHQTGQHLYGQDPYQPTHRSMAGQMCPVLTRDYMPPASRYIDPRNPPAPMPTPVPQQPQPSLNWQGSPPGASCAERLPGERGPSHDNQQYLVGATRIDLGWKVSDRDG